jgi:hypothetical protein
MILPLDEHSQSGMIEKTLRNVKQSLTRRNCPLEASTASLLRLRNMACLARAFWAVGQPQEPAELHHTCLLDYVEYFLGPFSFVKYQLDVNSSDMNKKDSSIGRHGGAVCTWQQVRWERAPLESYGKHVDVSVVLQGMRWTGYYCKGMLCNGPSDPIFKQGRPDWQSRNREAPVISPNHLQKCPLRQEVRLADLTAGGGAFQCNIFVILQ